jgi:hemerythrin-like domain-containing protein
MPKDAIELLMKDHEVVRGLLGQLARADGDGRAREELLTRIEKELQIHTTIEEEIFYPAFRAAGGKEASKLFYEAVEEHRAVEELVLPDLKNTDSAGERFSGRAKVLKDLVEHHAEEEEKEMLQKARKLFSAEQLAELGQRMEQRRKDLGA